MAAWALPRLRVDSVVYHASRQTTVKLSESLHERRLFAGQLGGAACQCLLQGLGHKAPERLQPATPPRQLRFSRNGPVTSKVMPRLPSSPRCELK